MTDSQTLQEALIAENNGHQAELLTTTDQNLTKDEVAKLNAGDEAVAEKLNDADQAALQVYAMDRLNHNQAIWPWEDIVMDPALAEVGKW